MTTRPANRQEAELISTAVARLRAGIMAMVFAMLFGVGLFVATVWLLIRGGPFVGQHLSLLRNYFPGYSVSWPGSILRPALRRSCRCLGGMVGGVDLQPAGGPPRASLSALRLGESVAASANACETGAKENEDCRLSVLFLQRVVRSPAKGLVAKDRSTRVSIVIPAFNEEGGISEVLAGIEAALDPTAYEYEVIVVDDGSTDTTAEAAKAAGAHVVSLPENRGYGAALKAGIGLAKHEVVAIIDADGTYPTQALPELLAFADRYEMVVGARTKGDVHIPIVRRPAKWFLRLLAGYLAGRRIPDLNSGMRVLRRPLFERFEHLLPSGFSFTTSITLAALCSDVPVRYHPIDYGARIGKSKIRATHAFDFFVLVLRSVVYFNPLRVFLPLGALLFLTGLVKLVHDLLLSNISETAVLGFLGAAIVWAVGLLSDQIARLSARSPIP